MSDSPLVEDVEQLLLFVDSALREAGIPYAFGGAIALAFCTRAARGTTDLDVNIFLAADKAPSVFECLAEQVRWTPEDLAAVKRDEQVRLWSKTGFAVDLFFAYDDFHTVAGRRVHSVAFGSVEIPVLDCTDLAVFKAMFNRTKDWADIEAALAGGTVDLRRLRTWITRLAGVNDPRHASIDRALEAVRQGRF
jgi:Fe-S-cluster formation regulator IscX/YfhJ